ncbi:MAG: response regulator, partial [Thermoanaerobaculia bacterium]
MTPAKPKILVVDDDEQILTQMNWALKEEFEVHRAGDRPSALKVFQSVRPDLVILDLGLPPHPRDAREGLAALEEILRAERGAKVVIISGNADRENALKAVTLGACDFFSKPVDLAELKVVLGRALFLIELEREGEARPAAEKPFEEILGTSRPMIELFQKVSKVAST